MQDNIRKPLQQLLGYYTPSFFAIYCLLNNNSNNILKSDVELSVLAHEYFHFLQDVSTPFGLLNLCNYYNFVRYASHRILQSPKNRIKLPIKIRSKLLNSAINSFSIINPNNDDFTRTELLKYNLVLVKEPLKIVDNKIFQIYSLLDRAKGFRYQIGSRDILESMAYAIERYLFGDQNPAPLLPYQTVDVILNSLYPEFAGDLQIISVLCEIALYSSHPVEMFFAIIDRFKKEKYQVKSLNDIIKYSFRGLSFSILDGQRNESFESAVSYSFECASKQIFEFLKAPQFKSIWQWSETVLNNAFTKRTNDRAFITQSLMNSNGKTNLFSFMKSEIGIPVIINGNGEAFSFDQAAFSDMLLLFPAIEQVFEQVLYEGSECKLFPICERAFLDKLISYNPSSICCDSPWNKAKENNLCPFANAWYSWGFSTKEFYKIKS